MKRTAFKRSKTPLKRTKMRKVGKANISKIQREIWDELRRVADLTYPPINGDFHCFTCDKIITGSNKQLGHFIPKSVCGAYLKYDLRNLRWQCFACNIHRGGNGAEFYKRLVEKHGQEYVDNLFRDKNVSVKALDFYIELLQTLKNTS